jgi:hypothetical protein
MTQVNEAYLGNLIRDLHNAEHELFSQQKRVEDEKLVKLNQLKAKQISNLKYNAQKLMELLEKIDYQVRNPKLKVVGI